MTAISTHRTLLALTTLAAAALAAAAPLGPVPADLLRARDDDRATTLQVRTGDEARLRPGFLAVVDLDERALACGGLPSERSGRPGIVLFDVSRPRHPRFLGTVATPSSSSTDDDRRPVVDYFLEEDLFFETALDVPARPRGVATKRRWPAPCGASPDARCVRR